MGKRQKTQLKTQRTNKSSGPIRLSTVTLDNGKTYFIDRRLRQLRNVENPHDFIDSVREINERIRAAWEKQAREKKEH